MIFYFYFFLLVFCLNFYKQIFYFYFLILILISYLFFSFLNLNLNNIYEAPQPNCTISSKNKDTAYQLTITDMDVLYQYIFPFFKDLTFLSRKGVDFKI